MAWARMALWFIFILIVHVAASLHHMKSHFTVAIQENPYHQSNRVYFQDGDVILGGLFPLHNYLPDTCECARIRDSRALMLVEAMVYAVERINNDTELLPNVQLGFEIYDSCYSDIWTLKQALNFIPPDQKRSCLLQDAALPEAGGQIMTCLHMKRIAGVVGAQRSASSAELAILLGLYKIPQVSYLSTLDTLNQAAYPYFLRVVPSDSHQVNAIIDLALYFGWTYISLLFSDNEYGENGYYEFTKQADHRGVCLAHTAQISAFYSEEYYDDLIANLRRDPYNRASVVVLFAHLGETTEFLKAVQRNYAEGEFTFIASDGIGSFGKQGLSGFEEAALGMITVVPYSKRNPDFLKYFIKTLASDSPNPWIKEYTDRYSWCDFLPGYICPVNRTGIMPPHETLVTDSVYVFAHALNSMLRNECENPDDFTDCKMFRNIDGAKLFSYMKNTSFESLSNDRVSFDANRDGNIRYKIRNLNTVLGWTTYVDVATWEESKKLYDINDFLIRFYTNDTGGLNGTVPTSVCSPPCPLGFRKSFADESSCCWHCEECEANSTVVKNNTECHQCTPPQWPNSDRTECASMQENYMSWDKLEGIVIKIIVFISMFEAFLVLALYFTRFRHRIVQRSDPIICVCIEAGVCLALVGAFFTTLQPSTAICVVARVAPSVAYSFIFVPFAVKCARLYRVFVKARDTDSEEEANLLSLKKQLFIMSLFWTVQIGISVAWIVVFPPAVSYTFTRVDDAADGGNSVILEVACNFQLLETITEIASSMPFLLASITLSLLARALPDNYHETRFCAFASACTLLVLVGAYAASFGSYLNATTMATMYRALGMTAISVVMMTCLFAPKTYVIYLVRGDIDEVMLKKRQSMASMAMYRSRASTVSSGVPMMNGSSSQGGRRSRAKSLKSVSEAPSTSGDKDTAIELKAISTSVI